MLDEKKTHGLVDINELTKDALGGAADGPLLRLLRVFSDPVDVRLFTAQTVAVTIHWYQADSSWMAIRCNGEPCALCLARRTPSTVLLLPVFDAVAREVSLLPVPKDLRAGSLLSALRPHLGDGGGKGLLEISKTSSKRYQVVPLAGGDDLDLGDDAISEFVALTEEATDEDLTALYSAVYLSLTNQELLRDFPDLATRIRHRHRDIDLESL